jgi:hypothetical protein
MNHAATSIATPICLLLIACAPPAVAQRYSDFSTKTPLEDGNVLIIGFVGGRESWDDKTQGVRKFALALRAQNRPGVFVETVRNNKRRVAIELIRNAFDRNRDGRLDESESASARLVVYGQSFGGAAVVKLARQLEKMKVPILLTVQIDSVGRKDGVIPANVIRAANLFQRNGLIIKGEHRIRARDPSATAIIGNFEFDYRHKKIDISGVAWIKKIFRSAHTKMDQDPAVWSLVEKLIHESISSNPDSMR